MDETEFFNIDPHLRLENLVSATSYVDMSFRRRDREIEKASKRLPLVSVQWIPNYDNSLPSESLQHVCPIKP